MMRKKDRNHFRMRGIDVDMNMNESSEQFVSLLGQPYDSKQVQVLLEPFGVKRVGKPDGPFQDDIIWSVKASVRIDVYRSPKINTLTGRDDLPRDEWVIGAIHFLAPGSDDRIKKPFSGQPPKGITMNAFLMNGSPRTDNRISMNRVTGLVAAALIWHGASRI